MDVIEVVVSRSTRMNTGDFEGTEHFISMKAEVNPDFDDLEDVKNQLAQKVEKAMVEQLWRSYKVRGKKLTREAVAKRHGYSYV